MGREMKGQNVCVRMDVDESLCVLAYVYVSVRVCVCVACECVRVCVRMSTYENE